MKNKETKSDHSEINKDLYSDEESKSTSNKDTESKDPNKFLTIAIKNLVD
ncbi:15516_t:CDS:2 [Cetraspora pellucida]|uniref:15516_t:CDS:1 n=1 Tax=Cetraspora pellucida TaxID=1433469 RepID=A0A9N9GXN5_9GLOM|nr:15516_t:CDS:2 [Cetraspora pellucida]